MTAGRIALLALAISLGWADPSEAGTIVVKHNTEPNSSQVFNYTAGGGLSPGSFQLDDDGVANNGISNMRTFTGVPAGTGYSISQATPAGYDPAQATCSDGSPPSGINLAASETVTCTFMSRLSTAGTITVVKDAEPNSLHQFSFFASGPTPPGHVGFSLYDNGPGQPGSPESSGFAVNPGSGYLIREDFSPGWVLTFASCSDGSPTFSIDISPNEDVVCTFVNVPAGTIRVVTDATPNDPQDFQFTTGGGLSPETFVLDDDHESSTPAMQTFSNVPPGDGYLVAETVPAGWDQSSATCSDGSSVSNIDVSLGETITCTFTNQKRGTLIAKLDTQPDDPQDFTFTAGGGLAPAAFDLDDDGDTTLPSEQAFNDLPAGSGYSLSQSLPAGWDQVSATCSNGSPLSDIEIGPAETVTCTFQSARSDAARITVVKDAQPDHPQDFGFTASGGLSPSIFSLDDDGNDHPLRSTRTFIADPGTYSIAEDDEYGWAEDSAGCSDGSPATAIDLSSSERITCTFANVPRNEIREAGVKGSASSAQISADGRHLVFASDSTNISPDDQVGNTSLFIRDLQTAETKLVSRASGIDGANFTASVESPYSVSADGRYVAFRASSTVYVRDVTAATTTIASRADGTDGTATDGISPSISADGRYVAFTSIGLAPGGPWRKPEVHVRDLIGGTTTLVSPRETAIAGGDGDSGSPSISADGRRVAFVTKSKSLDPRDTDALDDVYVRDLDTNETTLASVSTGGVKGNFESTRVSISGDGKRVAFGSNASNLDPADTEQASDVFVRDLEAGTTVLVSRATGVAGADSNAAAVSSSLSADGRFVVFSSAATNLDPPPHSTHVFVRDLDANTTTVISRATGAAGAKGNNNSGGPSLSGDGRWVAFASVATNLSPDDTDSMTDIYVRDRLLDVTSLQSRGSAGYPRPQAATPADVPLVPAYAACSAANRTHAAPLNFDSCAPPTMSSSHLTLGTPEANGRSVAGVGSVRYRVLAGDVELTVNATDVRNRADLTDYTGELRLEAPLRITDRLSDPTELPAATVVDRSLDVVVPCAATVDPMVGSTCSIASTLNSLIPGIIQSGFRSIWELGQISVADGGADGDGDTAADNQPFLRQGVFVP